MKEKKWHMEWGLSEIYVWWLPLVGCTNWVSCLTLLGLSFLAYRIQMRTHCPDRQGLGIK